MVDLDALRKEIFGANGFVAKLRRQFGLDSPQHLAERTQQVVLSQFRQVTCQNVNDFLCALLDTEYGIYQKLEHHAITNAIEIVLQSPEFPNLHQLISTTLQTVGDSFYKHLHSLRQRWRGR